MGSRSVDDLIDNVLQQIFRDEPIRPRKDVPKEKLPSLLRAARSLETGTSYFYQNRRSLFLKQGKLLANYEDDFPERVKVTRYYPTYDALTDRELRSYFSWRTRVRRWEIGEACTTFAFLYLYELINQIGVESPVAGLQKMDAFVDAYGKLDGAIFSYYRNWRKSYILYYNLSDSFWQEEELDAAVQLDILDSAPERGDDALVGAVLTLAPTWLRRSKFYRSHRQEMDTVIAGTMRQMCLHYRKRGGRSLSEQLFGGQKTRPFDLFFSAMFCDPLKKRDATYYLTDTHYFVCTDGYWTEVGRFADERGKRKLEELMKAIDASLRDALEPGKPIQRPTQMRWVDKIIQEEIQSLLDEKQKAAQAAKRIAIDYSALDAIRRDAAVTQERLAIEDEMEQPQETPPPAPAPEEPVSPDEDCPLDAAQYRLMQCLLYGRDTRWVQQEGKMLSVLLDSINEKLYDVFQDSVIEGETLVEDYIDELKEMVKP